MLKRIYIFSILHLFRSILLFTLSSLSIFALTTPNTALLSPRRNHDDLYLTHHIQYRHQSHFLRHLDPSSSSSSSPSLLLAELSSENSDDAAPPEIYPMGKRRKEDKDSNDSIKITAIQRDLVNRAKSIGTLPSGSYSSVGWSNRLGSVLTPVGGGVYVACRPFLWNKIDVGCRMTVIELPPDSNELKSLSESSPELSEEKLATKKKPDLFVHSPVSLDGPLMAALNDIGTVRHVVSPNYEHVKFAGMWGEAYPEACMWGCPGMMEREPDVRWTGEIPYGIRPNSWCDGGNNPTKQQQLQHPKLWDFRTIQPLHLDIENNPFTSTPFFNEVVFYHEQSGTLLTTDSYWNYPAADGVANSNFGIYGNAVQDFGSWELAPDVDKIPLGSSLWKFGMDKLFRPFYLNLMVKSERRDDFVNMASFMSGIESPTVSSSISNKWNVRTVIPAHGDIVRGVDLIQNVLGNHFDIVK